MSSSQRYNDQHLSQVWGVYQGEVDKRDSTQLRDSFSQICSCVKQNCCFVKIQDVSIAHFSAYFHMPSFQRSYLDNADT
jgi:hypothetical protein